MPRPQPRAFVAGIAILVACAISFGATSSEAFQTRSDLKGASLVALRTLPRSPENGALDSYCDGYRAKKLTSVGSQVAKLGWIVTSEAPLGRYQVVTFASGFTPGTSAICYARNANIAIFDGARPIALAHARRSADIPFVTVEPLESGALLIWSDPPAWPVGELHAQSSGFRLTPVARQSTFCHGRAVVPNVYGKPIQAARRTLIAHGWRPQRSHERPDEWDLATHLVKRGVIEAESCSGTGAGYCGFNYRGPAGVLSVTTAGDGNSVVSYGVECSAK